MMNEVRDRAMKRMTLMIAALSTAAVLSALPAPQAAAQNIFAPVITIDGRAITRYELNQREAFLGILRAPGNLAEQAEEALINERLQAQAATRAGLVVTEEQLRTGMSEFAARANLETDAFVTAIGQVGISAETFRDFVVAGLLWREYVQARFAAPARVTESEVDRALEQAAQETGARVRLAEVVLSTAPERAERTLELINEITANGRNADDFTAYARRFSMAPSRTNGGLRDWVELNEIPPALAEVILTLRPGEISDPVPLGENVIALFQVRGLTEIGPRPAANVEVDYITVAIPGGRSEAALAEAEALRAGAGNDCDGLYPLVRGENQDRLTRSSVAPRSLPSDLSLAISDMDPGESTSAITRNNGTVLLFTMLCGRAPVLEGDEARQRAQLALFNQRLTSLANGHLEELKAKAFIDRL